jgi:DtxR family Mn-dependent transcriptional regulator
VAVSKNENLSASLEDYLEAIFNLTGASKPAHSKDIAETLGVSRASVTGALRSLKEKGLVNYKPYDCVSLTETGRLAAADVVRKHNILKSFFINVLGVQADIAHTAACKAEHALGPAIITRLLCLIDFVTEEGKNGYDLVGRFQRFCEDNLHEYRHETGKKQKVT